MNDHGRGVAHRPRGLDPAHARPATNGVGIIDNGRRMRRPYGPLHVPIARRGEAMPRPNMPPPSSIVKTPQ